MIGYLITALFAAALTVGACLAVGVYLLRRRQRVPIHYGPNAKIGIRDKAIAVINTGARRKRVYSLKNLH